MDGKFVPWEEASVHALSHTLHYGGGAFEGIRVYETEKGPAVFRLDEHIKRLFYSAGALKMKIPYSEEEIKKVILETVSENKLSSCYIRPLVIYGYGELGLKPKNVPINVIVAAWSWGAYLGDKETVSIKTSSMLKTDPRSTDLKAKICGNYVNSILASFEISDTDYDEVLFLDFEGNVAEGAGENIFIVKDNVLYTPEVGSILPGITRDSVLEIARDLNIKTEEKKLALDDVKTADEAFFTGTAVEITAIGKIDEIVINQNEVGEVTKKVKAKFFEAVKGQNEKYKDWLTIV